MKKSSGSKSKASQTTRLSPGKKRVSLALSADRYAKFQSLCREIGLVRGFESAIIDSIMVGLTAALEKMIESKKISGKELTAADALAAFNYAMGPVFDEQKDLDL